LWCAKPKSKFTQVAVVSNGADWLSNTVSFSPDSKFMVCISSMKKEAQVRLQTATAQAATRPASEMTETAMTEILIYDLDRITQGYEEDIKRVCDAAQRPVSSAAPRHHVAVQDLVLEYVRDSTHVWLEEVAQHLQHHMGTGPMRDFFSAHSTASSIHEIALDRSQRTIAFLSKSCRATGGHGHAGERVADVIFLRGEAVSACQAGVDVVAAPHAKGQHRRVQGRGVLELPEVDRVMQEQLHLNSCMVLEWLLKSPKLFQIVWNSYVFNTNASQEDGMAVMANGRVATKIKDTPAQAPCMIWLNPSVPEKMNAEVEFMIESWTASLPEDGLRIGVLQRGLTTAAAPAVDGHLHRAKAPDSTWMYGCGTGMRFHSKGRARNTESYVKLEKGGSSNQQGKKFSVVLDRTRNTVSIKINGLSQGVMFHDIPSSGPLFLALHFMSTKESVRIPEAFVTSGWCKKIRHIEIDSLDFKIT
jgi:hypothetical protein